MPAAKETVPRNRPEETCPASICLPQPGPEQQPRDQEGQHLHDEADQPPGQQIAPAHRMGQDRGQHQRITQERAREAGGSGRIARPDEAKLVPGRDAEIHGAKRREQPGGDRKPGAKGRQGGKIGGQGGRPGSVLTSILDCNGAGLEIIRLASPCRCRRRRVRAGQPGLPMAAIGIAEWTGGSEPRMLRMC